MCFISTTSDFPVIFDGQFATLSYKGSLFSLLNLAPEEAKSPTAFGAVFTCCKLDVT
jgi:hypothetical protein